MLASGLGRCARGFGRCQGSSKQCPDASVLRQRNLSDVKIKLAEDTNRCQLNLYTVKMEAGQSIGKASSPLQPSHGSQSRLIGGIEA
jgi:hypothetical protein